MNSYELFVTNEHPRAAGLPGVVDRTVFARNPGKLPGLDARSFTVVVVVAKQLNCERPPWSWVDRLGSCTQQEYIRLTMAVMVTRVVTEMAEMT